MMGEDYPVVADLAREKLDQDSRERTWRRELQLRMEPCWKGHGYS